MTLQTQDIVPMIRAFARVFREQLGDIPWEDPAYLDVQKAFERIAGFSDQAPIHLSPCEKPVTRHWQRVTQHASKGRLRPMAELLSELSPFLSWMDDPDYRGADVDAAFLENYGCFELVGTKGIIHDQWTTLGCMLLSPEIYFPLHAHPQYELLYILSGRGTWHMDKGQIISMPKETHILIPENRRHAFWSVGNLPMAAVYICSKPPIHNEE